MARQPGVLTGYADILDMLPAALARAGIDTGTGRST
jgi:hypothetical protein